MSSPSSIKVIFQAEITGPETEDINIYVPARVISPDQFNLIILSFKTSSGLLVEQIFQPQFEPGISGFSQLAGSYIYNPESGITSLILYARQSEVQFDRTGQSVTEYHFLSSELSFMTAQIIALTGVDLTTPFIAPATSAQVTGEINPFQLTLTHPQANSGDLVINTIIALNGTIVTNNNTDNTTLDQSIIPNSQIPIIQTNLRPASQDLTSIYIATNPNPEVVTPNVTVPQGTSITLQSILTCVARDTEVLMADGTVRLIQDLRRGDWVSGNLELSIRHQIARVNHTLIQSQYKPSLVKIRAHSLGLNRPYRDLLITSPHPIILDKTRRPACCYREFSGVTWLPSTEVAELHLPADAQGVYMIYDLVFDHDGDYVANGLVVQAHSPYHPYDPLPPELYFNSHNYQSKVDYEGLNHPLPYDDQTLVDPIEYKTRKFQEVTFNNMNA